MKITIENTPKVIDLVTDISNGNSVPARLWEGETDTGIKVQVLVTRIAVSKEDDSSQFEKELQQQKAPSAEIQAYPLRLIL